MQKAAEELTKCEVCYESYNRSDREPLLICSMHHTICRTCMSAIELTRKCPFCRDKIDFTKIVRNNYVYRMLFNEPEPSKPLARNIKPDEQPPAAIERMLVHRSYNQHAPGPGPVDQYAGYMPQAQALGEQDIYHQDLVEPEVPYQPRTSQNELFLRDTLDLEQGGLRQAFYFSVLILQIPFIIFDLAISLTAPQSPCMDTPHVMTYYILRSWLLAMGITEVSLIVLLSLGVCLRLVNAFGIDGLKVCDVIVGFLMFVKIIMWCIVELSIYFADVTQNCGGVVFGYMTFLTILHLIFALVFIVLGNCK